MVYVHGCAHCHFCYAVITLPKGLGMAATDCRPPVAATAAARPPRPSQSARAAGRIRVAAVSLAPWLLLVACHTVCAVYPLLVGLLYVFLPRHAPSLLSTAELYSVSVPRRHFPKIAAVYFLIATLHLSSLFDIIRNSLVHRRLLLAAPRSPATSTRQGSSSPWSRLQRFGPPLTLLRSAWLRRRTSSLSGSRVHSISITAVRSMKTVLSATDVVDRNFDTTLMLRELLETAVLSYQVYTVSYSVASVWTNHALVALLLVNCWAMPVIRWLPGIPIKRVRLLCLCANLLLDLAAYLVIPIMLFLPYYEDYIPARGDVALVLWYTDLWLVRMLNEWPMLFVSSVWDAISTFFIGLSIARTMSVIPRLVEQWETTASAATTSHLPRPSLALVKQVEVQHRSPSQVLNDLSAALRGPERRPSLMSQRRQPSRIEALGHRLLSVWGFIVLGLHVHAASRGSNEQCIQQVRPWLAGRSACSLMEISCLRDVDAARATAFDRALSSVDRRWLSYLIVRHCPAVEITPLFNELSNLVGMKIYNSSIADWGRETALTNRYHGRMLFVFLASTNMTQLPRGLFDPDFPPLLGDIEISRTNLTELPRDVLDSWPTGLFLVMEGAAFREVPDVIAELEPYHLSLDMNGFTSIPAKVLASPQLLEITLNGNPISALPPTMETLPALRRMWMKRTKLSDLPSWVNVESFGVRDGFVAGDTPLCDALSSISASSNVSERWQALKSFVDCTPPTIRDELFYFPIQLEPGYQAES
ncbi:hypothetical protein PINS_up000761 [Pythium insidiosum]|nr:hypothetical protein PINS_up000761 [Pythium insidiosum]